MTIGQYQVGLIGAGFMAKAHSLAYASMPMFFWPAPGIPVRNTVCDVTEPLAEDAALRLGFEHSTDDWRTVVNDPNIDIVDICTPNNTHAEIAIAAAENKKHIICEKPLAVTSAEARAMLAAARENDIRHMVAFNYRKTPAVALAKEIISNGEVGEILTYRGTYLQDWSADAKTSLSWRFRKDVAGTGALGDIGTHVIDLARFLVGDFKAVSGDLKTYIHERPLPARPGHSGGRGVVDVDDEASFAFRFSNGATGSIEASRNAWGRNNYLTFEIHGTEGSIYFDYEHRDVLQVYYASAPHDRRGFRTIYTGPNHPYGNGLWPIAALGIGYSETKIVETYDFIKAISEGVDPHPNFADGLAISLICDAVVDSNQNDGAWTDVAEL